MRARSRSWPGATATSPSRAVVSVELDGDDVRRCAIGLLGLGSTPERATAAESAATGSAVGDVDVAELGEQAMSGLGAVPSDLHGSDSYRRASAAMVRRSMDAPWRRPGVLETAVEVRVNGVARRVTVEPRLTLADLLRERFGLTGTHLGCEHGVCGACTVLVDGGAVRSCLVFAVQADGAEITTIEGWRRRG